MSRDLDRTPDIGLSVAVAALLVIGIAMVYSSSFVIAHNEFQDDLYFLVRQLIWAAVGTAALVALAWIDYHRWQRLSVLAMGAAVLALVLVLTPAFGQSAYGAQRWLRLGPLPIFQPSEFAKLGLVLYLADWLARKNHKVGTMADGFVPFGVVLGVVSALIMAQPDMGTTAVVVATAISIYWVAGANILHLFLGMLMLVLLAVWFATSAEYRLDRLAAFIDPWSDAQARGWHTVQTLIALGSGGVAGLGLGASRQKFYYIPNAHTDAIFAIIGEELGLIGTLVVLSLFAVVAWRGLAIALGAGDRFGRLLAAGATSLILWQAILNMAVVTKTLPYTGVTLPFISFGGSSLVVSMMAVGLILSVSRIPGHADEPPPGHRLTRYDRQNGSVQRSWQRGLLAHALVAKSEETERVRRSGLERTRPAPGRRRATRARSRHELP